MKYCCLLILAFTCLSCQPDKPKAGHDAAGVEKPQAENVELTDSLTNDTTTYRDEHINDSAIMILDQLHDTLWQYIDESKKSKFRFPDTSFFNRIRKEDFDTVRSGNNMVCLKSAFNQRMIIQFDAVKPDTVGTYVKIWYKGRSYEKVVEKTNINRY